jgi:hypothetical protein
MGQEDFATHGSPVDYKTSVVAISQNELICHFDGPPQVLGRTTSTATSMEPTREPRRR